MEYTILREQVKQNLYSYKTENWYREDQGNYR
jgi:hypothetical protein